MNNDYEYHAAECGGLSKKVGQKLMFLLIGGGIGAAAALLFAPKPGREIREDIAELTVDGYKELVSEANRVKDRTTDIYHSTLETRSELRDAVAASASAIKKEVVIDLGQIGAILERSGGREFTNY